MQGHFEKREKVLVALSGGVDSAAAAAILKKQGYEVVGVHFRFFNSAWKPNFQVKEIADKLGIPLKIVDARKEFRKRVIDYFVLEYKSGRTPNPCVICNKEMKFRLLFDLMKKEKADAVATGHYARIMPDTRNIRADDKTNPVIQLTGQKKNQLRIADFKLCQSKDQVKDQSYFLYRLSQKDLSWIIFPLGGYKKSEAKEIADKMRLPVQKNESQDVCFLVGMNINSYLKKHLRTKSGNIIDENGIILGRHEGLSFYTIGQRKGIKIGGTGPYFVVGKNVWENELVVTNDPQKLLAKKFLISQVNWVHQGVKLPLRAKIQIRYRAPRVNAIIRKVGNKKLEVKSERYLRAVTPGQSAVFYKKGEVLGGGIII